MSIEVNAQILWETRNILCNAVIQKVTEKAVLVHVSLDPINSNNRGPSIYSKQLWCPKSWLVKDEKFHGVLTLKSKWHCERVLDGSTQIKKYYIKDGEKIPA